MCSGRCEQQQNIHRRIPSVHIATDHNQPQLKTEFFSHHNSLAHPSQHFIKLRLMKRSAEPNGTKKKKPPRTLEMDVASFESFGRQLPLKNHCEMAQMNVFAIYLENFLVSSSLFLRHKIDRSIR